MITSWAPTGAATVRPSTAVVVRAAPSGTAATGRRSRPHVALSQLLPCSKVVACHDDRDRGLGRRFQRPRESEHGEACEHDRHGSAMTRQRAAGGEQQAAHVSHGRRLGEIAAAARRSSTGQAAAPHGAQLEAGAFDDEEDEEVDEVDEEPLLEPLPVLPDAFVPERLLGPGRALRTGGLLRTGRRTRWTSHRDASDPFDEVEAARLSVR